MILKTKFLSVVENVRYSVGAVVSFSDAAMATDLLLTGAFEEYTPAEDEAVTEHVDARITA